MIEVVCAVIRSEEGILLCRRAEGVHLAGHWEFPGGKVEEGEDPREALAREIREELACEVRVGSALRVVEHSYPEIAIRLQPFACTISSGQPEALEHAEIGWYSPEAVGALGLAGADREVWERIKVQL